MGDFLIRATWSAGMAGLMGMALAVVVLSSPTQVPGRPVSPRVVTEDSAGWDCATMGNRSCGPTDSPVIYAP